MQVSICIDGKFTQWTCASCRKDLKILTMFYILDATTRHTNVSAKNHLGDNHLGDIRLKLGLGNLWL